MVRFSTAGSPPDVVDESTVGTSLLEDWPEPAIIVSLRSAVGSAAATAAVSSREAKKFPPIMT